MLRFGGLDFTADRIGKLSLLDSDSNQSGRENHSAPLGLPDDAKIYHNLLSSELDSIHSEESASSSSCCPPASREVAVVLQRLGSYESTDIDEHLSSNDFDDLYDISTDEINSYDADKDYYDPDLLNVLMAEVAETDSATARRIAEEERARLEQERKLVEEERAKLEQEHKRAEEESKRKEEEELKKKQDADKRRDLRATGRSAREAIMQTRVDNANIFQTPQQNAVAASPSLTPLSKQCQQR